MSDSPQAPLVFPKTVKGASISGMAFELFENDAAPASALSAVVCKFAKDGAVTLTPTMAINDAANWHFSMATVSGASTASMGAGLHEGDIKLTDATGFITKDVRVQLSIVDSPT